MTNSFAARASALVVRANQILIAFPPSITLFVMRVALAVPFWRSGVLKWEVFPFEINPIAVLLFSDEFRIHILGNSFGFPFPETVAHIAALAEVILPVMLVVGFATRFAALGLVAMTLVIQLTVPSGWPIHVMWLGLALGVMSFGSGRFSVDGVVKHYRARQ